MDENQVLQQVTTILTNEIETLDRSRAGGISVAESIIAMEHYLSVARRLLSTFPYDPNSADTLRIIRTATAYGLICLMSNNTEEPS